MERTVWWIFVGRAEATNSLQYYSELWYTHHWNLMNMLGSYSKKLLKNNNLEKRRISIWTFLESQFNYCLLIWMFFERTLNHRPSILHGKALKIASNFEELRRKDNTITIHQRNLRTLLRCIRFQMIFLLFLWKTLWLNHVFHSIKNWRKQWKKDLFNITFFRPWCSIKTFYSWISLIRISLIRIFL